jgi:hypothetical protein
MMPAFSAESGPASFDSGRRTLSSSIPSFPTPSDLPEPFPLPQRMGVRDQLLVGLGVTQFDPARDPSVSL